MLYRGLQTLDAGKKGLLAEGSMSALDWLPPADLETLTELGIVAAVHPPPLTVAPGWTLRARKLARIGVDNASQFLECPNEEVAAALGVSQAKAESYKAEVRDWLTVRPREGGG